jgi:hypothetical protein
MKGDLALKKFTLDHRAFKKSDFDISSAAGFGLSVIEESNGDLPLKKLNDVYIALKKSDSDHSGILFYIFVFMFF